jgi:hypothetical protein
MELLLESLNLEAHKGKACDHNGLWPLLNKVMMFGAAAADKTQAAMLREAEQKM